MFTGSMVTEAIPARVFALYKIVAAKKEITRTELKKYMEPEDISGKSSYFVAIIKAAIELKIICEQDGMIRPIVPKEQMKTISDLRRHAITILPGMEQEEFWQCSNIIVNMNEKIYMFDSLSDSRLTQFLTDKLNHNVTEQAMRGWRFWAQFLGFGLVNNMTFLPNAYLYIKSVIKLLDLEKNKEYSMDEFVNKFREYGEVMLSEKATDKTLNIAMSNGLRQLHDSGEIALKHGSDQEINWFLYPSTESFNQPITSIVYKGVNKDE